MDKLTKEERDDIKRLIEVFEAFRALNPEMPLQYAVAFLHVAASEGLAMNELAERIRMSVASVSRIVAAYTKTGTNERTGWNMLTSHEDPRERRRKLQHLTGRGATFASRLAAEMRGA